VALYATLSRGGVMVYGVALLLMVLMTKYKTHLFAYITFANIVAIVCAFLLFKLKNSYEILILVLGLILLALLFKLVEKVSQGKLYGILAALVLVPAVGLMINFSKTPFARLLRFDFTSNSFFTRYLFYVDSLKIFLQNPVIGKGGGAWEYVYKRYQTIPYDTTLAHSSLFQSLVEVGILGTSFFLLLIVAAGYMFFSRRKKGEVGTAEAGMFISFVVILAHSLIDFDFSLPYITIVFFIFIGLLTGKSELSIKLRAVKVIPIALLICALIISSSVSIAEVTFKNVNSAMNNGQISLSDYEKFKEAYQTAGKFDPLNSKYKISFGQLLIGKGMADNNTKLINEGIAES
jgi:O-antigen ligase